MISQSTTLPPSTATIPYLAEAIQAPSITMATHDPKDGGILYDGGFDSWNERLTALLSRHYLDQYIYIQNDAAKLSAHAKAEAAAALCMATTLIDSRVLQRVPANAKASLPDLMDWLRMRTRPFRFLDLPPELRNKIYGEVIPCNTPVIVRVRLVKQVPSSREPTVPLRLTRLAITQVARQIRKESSPLFYSRSIFEIFGQGWYPAPYGKAWLRAVPADQIRNLRTVKVEVLMARYGVSKMTIRHSQHDGLRIDAERKLDSKSQRKLEEYVGKIEKIRKLSNLKGETIAMALALDEGFWEVGNLTPA